MLSASGSGSRAPVNIHRRPFTHLALGLGAHGHHCLAGRAGGHGGAGSASSQGRHGVDVRGAVNATGQDERSAVWCCGRWRFAYVKAGMAAPRKPTVDPAGHGDGGVFGLAAAAQALQTHPSAVHSLTIMFPYAQALPMATKGRAEPEAVVLALIWGCLCLQRRVQATTRKNIVSAIYNHAFPW